MNRWPSRRILASVAIFLIFVGMLPMSYLFWWIRAHNLEPLSMAISLKQGEYTSPFFTTTMSGMFGVKEIDRAFSPHDRGLPDTQADGLG